MAADGFGDSLADIRHKSRVLELANRGIVFGGNTLELVVSVKFDFPTELSELLRKACFNKVNRTFVDTRLGLQINMLE